MADTERGEQHDLDRGVPLNEVQSELVRAHAGLAKATARRFAHRGVDVDDLEQVALLALVKLAPRFDPTKGTKFSTYAVTCMVGELKRHFRDKTWAMRVPRQTQETYLAVKHSRDVLVQRLGRSPTIPEITEHLGTTEEAVLEAIEAGQSFWPNSLDAPAPDDAATAAETLASDEDGYELMLQRTDLARVLPLLSRDEQVLLRLIFFEGWTQHRVGERLGVSQMQVSRRLHGLLDKLRHQLEASPM